MGVPPQLLQFLGSLAAILLLAGAVRWLGLGPAPVLSDEDAARQAAEEAVGGFEAVAVGLDSAGRGALLRDTKGQILFLRPHGTHFAGRLLSPLAHASLESEGLRIDSGDRRFGSALLEIPDAQTWAEAIAALRKR